MRDLVQSIQCTETGERSLPVGDSMARVQWRPVPHFAVRDEGAMADRLKRDEGVFCTFGPEPFPAIGLKRTLLLDEDATQLLVKSLRNTLKTKREQFPHSAQYVLVMKPGHLRLPAAGLRHLLGTRILPNPAYHWLTGVAVFTPRVRFEKGAPGSSVFLTTNDKATVPASTNLREAIGGGREFHLP
jgi:hypothetical protein